MLSRLREQGIQISDYVAQRSLWKSELTPRQKGLLVFFNSIGRKRKTIREFFRKYADMVIYSPAVGQETMFGVGLTAEDLMRALMEVEEELPQAMTAVPQPALV
jgi:hypothetical protein